MLPEPINGVGCGEPGCLQHTKYPCDACGRIGGFVTREDIDKGKQLQSWRRRHEYWKIKNQQKYNKRHRKY